jgi:hypothetical protein
LRFLFLPVVAAALVSVAVVADVVVSVGAVVVALSVEADGDAVAEVVVSVGAVPVVVFVVEPVAPVVPMVEGVEPVVVWARAAPGSATAASRAMNVFVMNSIRCYADRMFVDALVTTRNQTLSATLPPFSLSGFRFISRFRRAKCGVGAKTVLWPGVCLGGTCTSRDLA